MLEIGHKKKMFLLFLFRGWLLSTVNALKYVHVPVPVLYSSIWQKSTILKNEIDFVICYDSVLFFSF